MGMILGTAAYMAPEQARGKAVDRAQTSGRSACVLYEMLTGRRAFEGRGRSRTSLAAVLRQDDRLDGPARRRPRRGCGGCSSAVSTAT